MKVKSLSRVRLLATPQTAAQPGSSFHRIFQARVLEWGAISQTLGFPGGASGKESACQSRRCKKGGFDPWVGKIPWRRKWQPSILPWRIPWAEEPGGLQSMDCKETQLSTQHKPRCPRQEQSFFKSTCTERNKYLDSVVLTDQESSQRRQWEVQSSCGALRFFSVHSGVPVGLTGFTNEFG